jgi:DNA-binding transcriptional regulator YdaS (Cro superfamily)
MKVVEFGRRINFSPIHLYKIIHGERKPSLKLAKIIEKETNGEVTIEDLMKGNEDEK